MPIVFPSSPSNGDTYTVGGRTWTWSGTFWELNANTTGIASVGTANIADNAVTTEKIASGAVGEADIAANAVTTGKLGTDVQLGYRNVVINGAMQVAQRGTSTTGITGSGYNTADRWLTSLTTLGTWTQTVENDAPTGSGFRKSLKMLCTTADAAPAANDFMLMAQNIEGQNVQQFLKGTASAKPFSLSFWVKSNVTGTYIAEIRDPDNNRSVSASYTISASATWEKKTITFPADTTGVLDNDNATSISLIWWCGAGTDYTSGTLATTWATLTSANRAVGQVNLAAATNNYWQITGVQLEAGAVATPFEFEDYGTTLRKCQRYYFKHGASGNTNSPITGGGYHNNTTAVGIVRFPVTMRAAPTMSVVSGTNYYSTISGGTTDGLNSFTQDNSNADGSMIYNNTEASGTMGYYAHLICNNAASFIAWSIEL